MLPVVRAGDLPWPQEDILRAQRPHCYTRMYEAIGRENNAVKACILGKGIP